MNNGRRHAITGHLTTIYPSLRHRVAPYRSSPGQTWTHSYQEGAARIELSGIHSTQSSEACVVVVHGLGGDPHAAYVSQWSAFLFDAGYDVLRLGLRGSDGKSDRFYHIGLTADVERAVRELKTSYDHIYVLGFSLGGHIALRCATLGLDIDACCAVSPPIDLVKGVAFLDSPKAAIYRYYVLRELVAMYRNMERNGADLPATSSEVCRVRTIRDFDALTICRTYGYDSPDAYYQDNAMVSRLHQIVTPTYALVSPHDPMIAIDTVQQHLDRVRDKVQTRYVEGAGHVFFPYANDESIVGDIVEFFRSHR